MKGRSVALVSTLYAVEPVMVCVTEFSPKRIVLLREEDAPEEKKRAEKLIKDSVGKVVKIEEKETVLYDVVQVAKDTVDAIEKLNAEGYEIIVNISGGRKVQAIGVLFGAYARHTMVEKVVYVTEEDQEIVELPVLDYGLSDTKKLILGEIETGTRSVSAIAKKVGISRGMAYNHVKELRNKGFVEDKGGMKATAAGRLAIL
jgi:CRISPR-associated protein Csa3